MKPLNDYDEKSIVSRELIEEIFEEQDEIERSYMIADCSLRAKELGVLAIFKKLISERKRVEKEVLKGVPASANGQRYTDFPIPIDRPYDNMQCGQWTADSDGVVMYTVLGEQRACYHPILPVKRLQNVQTGEEKVVIAFKRDRNWKEITIDKEVISSSTKIVGLSRYGVAVTSENARCLVRYLSDVENLNNEVIEVVDSTTKMGWHGNDFIPFDDSIFFDGDTRFKQLREAISTSGDENVWIEHVKQLRATGRPEIRFVLASSFASVLIAKLGCLPFFVDLWGETEGGKSVSLMLGASVWANPDASQYIGDYKSTDVALEVRADMLNNLPVMLDDTSNATQRIVQDFENIIYRLCSGKGKSRSNKDLGSAKENNWKCCFITNGERPLSGYVTQGGAINRIIEIECGEKIFENPQKTASVLKANYGFAGRKFVEIVKGIDNLKERYDDICHQLFSSDKMQKQAMSLACIMLADQIATEHIFMDDCAITLEEAKTVLIDKDELSEGERAYQYLIGKIAMNTARFDATEGLEKWGFLKDGYICFYPPAFTDRCRECGFSKKYFLSWLKKKHKLLVDEDGNIKVQKIDGKTIRAISIKMDDGITVDENGFLQVDEQEELPFV